MYGRRPKSNFCGLSEANKQKREAFSRSGIWLQISVAYQRNVTFVAVSHGDSLPYPFVAFAPRFYLALRSVKLRLRASHSAQNDRLVDCFIVCVRFWTTFENDKCGGTFCKKSPTSPSFISPHTLRSLLQWLGHRQKRSITLLRWLFGCRGLPLRR